MRPKWLPIESTEPQARRLIDNMGFYSDRKSTRLNSSHSQISYAVFCLKKKKDRNRIYRANETTYQRPSRAGDQLSVEEALRSVSVLNQTLLGDGYYVETPAR